MKKIIQYICWITIIMFTFTCGYIIGEKRKKSAQNIKQIIQQNIYPPQNEQFPPIEISTISGQKVKYSAVPLLWLFENGHYVITKESNYNLPFEYYSSITIKSGDSLIIDYQKEYDAISFNLRPKWTTADPGNLITPELESSFDMKIEYENGKYKFTPPPRANNFPFTIWALDYERGIVSFYFQVVVEE